MGAAVTRSVEAPNDGLILRAGLVSYIPGVEFNETSAAEMRYWTLWKLPLFGARSVQEIMAEVQSCRQENPSCYIRVMGFDNVKQCQVLSFIVHKPNTRGY